MTATTTIEVQMDEQINADAMQTLAAMGMTASDAVRLLLTRVALEKTMPFDVRIPNETTLAAMREAEAGNLPRYADAASFMRSLREDD